MIDLNKINLVYLISLFGLFACSTDSRQAEQFLEIEQINPSAFEVMRLDFRATLPPSVESDSGVVHLTYVGATQTTKAEERVLYFDGVDDYIKLTDEENAVPKALKSLKTGTIVFRFSVHEIPVQSGIAPLLYFGAEAACESVIDASNKGFIIEVGHSPVHPGSRRLYATFFPNECGLPALCFDSDLAIPEKEWVHVAVVMSESYNTLFINGKEVENRRYNFGTKSMRLYFDDAVAKEELLIGKGFWRGKPEFFKGEMANVFFYSKALTTEEIQWIYQRN